MNVKRLADLTAPPVVGRRYLVPCVVVVLPDGRRKYLPVLGPWHEDRDFFKFPHEHYHVDWRFVSDRLGWVAFRIDREQIRMGNCLGWPVTKTGTDSRKLQCGYDGNAPLERVLACKRRQPKFPRGFQEACLPKEFWRAFADTKLSRCLVCPHRGINLSSQPVVDGIVTCPGHGLRFNVRTRKLIPLQQEAP